MLDLEGWSGQQQWDGLSLHVSLALQVLYFSYQIFKL
jgi:hypothetical protein